MRRMPQISSMVVLCCKLSSTTLNLILDEYCLRFLLTLIRTFLAYYTVYITKYGTHCRAGSYYLSSENALSHVGWCKLSMDVLKGKVKHG